MISDYLHEQSKIGAERIWNEPETSPGNEIVRLRRARICDETAKSIASADIRSPVAVEITYDVLRNDTVVSPSFQLYDDHGVCIFVSLDQDQEWREKKRKCGTYISRALIPGNLLAEGSMFVTIVIATFEPLYVHVEETELVTFRIFDPIDGNSARGNYAGKMHGLIRPILHWETVLK